MFQVHGQIKLGACPEFGQGHVIEGTKEENVSLAVYLKKLADDMNYAALLKFTESRKADVK